MKNAHIAALMARRRSSGAGDPFYNDVVWGMHMDGINGSILFPDFSSYNRAFFAWQSTVDTANALYGSGAVFFNGNHYISTPDAPELRMQTTDFTFEMSFKPISIPGFGLLLHKAINNGFYPWQIIIQPGGSVLFRGFDNIGPNLIYSISGGVITPGVYNTVAAMRKGNLFVLFVGGIAVASVLLGGGLATLYADTGDVITGESAAFASPLLGYEDEFRMTAVARHGGVTGLSPYTPAIGPFPNHL